MALIYDRLGTASQAVKPSSHQTLWHVDFSIFFAMRFVWCDIINKYLVISDVWFWNWDFYFGNVKKTPIKKLYLLPFEVNTEVYKGRKQLFQESFNLYKNEFHFGNYVKMYGRLCFDILLKQKHKTKLVSPK